LLTDSFLVVYGSAGSPVVEREGFIARILHYCAFSGTAIGESSIHPLNITLLLCISQQLYSIAWG